MNKVPRDVTRTINRLAHALARDHYVRIRAELIEAADLLLAAGVPAEAVIDQLCARQAPARV